ncbi:MAG: methyltransferase [Deltaproteobacteria bacterium]|nr:methyltransferase [Deltaproteobacteria bacterium]
MNEQTPATIRRPRSDDRPLWDVYWGAYGYFAVHIAHGVGVFTLLANGPQTLDEVCQALGLKRRAAEAVLAVCVSHGLLAFNTSRYALTTVAEDYLLPTSPTYFGSQFDWNLAHPEIITLDRIQRAVLTDQPQAFPGGKPIFSTLEEEMAMAKQFTHAMHSSSMGPATAWPEKIDLSGHHVLLDVGGGSGAHAIGALWQWPHLRGSVLDRLPVCEVAQEYATKYRLTDRLGTHAADMWKEPYPAADLHFYGMIFHDWPAEQCRFLARKSFESLPTGGRIIVHEMLFNHDRTGPFGVAAFNMVMLTYLDGEQYSGREIAGFFSEAGFTDIEVKPTFGYWSIVAGRKP